MDRWQVDTKAIMDRNNVVLKRPTDAKLVCQFTIFVRENWETQIVVLLRLTAVSSTLHGNSNQSCSLRTNVSSNFFKSLKLDVAVRAPNATIEGHNDWTFCQQVVQ